MSKEIYLIGDASIDHINAKGDLVTKEFPKEKFYKVTDSEYLSLKQSGIVGKELENYKNKLVAEKKVGNISKIHFSQAVELVKEKKVEKEEKKGK